MDENTRAGLDKLRNQQHAELYELRNNEYTPEMSDAVGVMSPTDDVLNDFTSREWSIYQAGKIEGMDIALDLLEDVYREE